jgi:hypothetical protein
MRSIWPFQHRRRELLRRGGWARGALQIGTDPSTIAPTVLNANADVTCTAGTAVTAIHSQSAGSAVPLQMVNRFDVYPLIMGVLTLLLGGTAPSALVISYATVSGTAILSYTVEPGLLVNSAELVVPFFLVGPVSSTLYTTAAVDPLVQVTATGQAVTAKKVGSMAIFQLVPGVD